MLTNMRALIFRAVEEETPDWALCAGLLRKPSEPDLTEDLSLIAARQGRLDTFPLRARFMR